MTSVTKARASPGVGLFPAARDEDVGPQGQREKALRSQVEASDLEVAPQPRGQARRGSRAEKVPLREIGGEAEPLLAHVGSDDFVVEREAVAEAVTGPLFELDARGNGSIARGLEVRCRRCRGGRRVQRLQINRDAAIQACVVQAPPRLAERPRVHGSAGCEGDRFGHQRLACVCTIDDHVLQKRTRPGFDEDVDIDTRLLQVHVDLRRYARTRLQKPCTPETTLDLIDTVGERRALIAHAGHDTQGFAHLRLGKPAGALEVDSPDNVRLAFAHHDAHDGGPVPDLGLLDVDFRREQAFVAIHAFD